MKFIAVLAFITLIGFAITLPYLLEQLADGNATEWDITLECLDLITITVPPALPTCL